MAKLENLELGRARLPEAARIAGMSRRWIEHGLTWRYRREQVANQIRNPETEVVVARDGEIVVAFAVMEFQFDVRRAHLVLLAVEPAYRRSGAGETLFHWLEKIARRGGITGIQLELRADNGGARAFYEGLGFRATGIRRDYYDGQQDALSMDCAIGRASE